MTIGYNTLRVVIDADRLAANFTRIRQVSGNPIPVIKADAYGHGLREVAGVYWRLGAQTMAVGTVGEAAVLKELFPQVDVVSLLGPLDAVDYVTTVELGILVFVGQVEQARRLNEEACRQGRTARIALKFDTGMARLGFAVEERYALIELLANLQCLCPVMVCSHLATADDPGQREHVVEQGRLFADVFGTFRAQGYAVQGCLANSGAIFGYPELHYDMQRPGIALYGVNPFEGTAWAEKGVGLQQAMEVSTRLLQVRDIPAGRTVSYGRTFRAERGMRIGIVAAGYADNYSRSASNCGWMLIHGRRVPVLGRVCMQLTAVDLQAVPEAQAGDVVYVLGGPGPQTLSVGELAAWWKTISYEVLCLLGQNPREYRGL